MRSLVYIQNTDELWESEGDYTLEKGEVFSLDVYDGNCFVEERWLEVVDKEKDIKSGMTKYNTKIANVPWAKK